MKKVKAGEATKKSDQRHASPVKLTGESFDALSSAEKERIWQDLDGQTAMHQLAHSRLADAAERQAWQRVKKRTGRPKLGRDGVKVISLSLEKELLRQADAYAKQHHVKRSELISQGIRIVLGISLS